MTVQLDWPQDIVDRIAKQARRQGVSMDAYVLQAVLQLEVSNGSAPSDDAMRQAREQAGRNIRELRKNNILGTDLTIRDLIQEGRRY